MVKEAEGIHENRLYKNAKILKFGLAFNIKDNKFKRSLVYAIKNGKFPESIPELVNRHELGLRKWENIKSMADRTVKTTNNLAYGYFPNLKGGWVNMLAKYLAESTGKRVGVSILKTFAAQRAMSRRQKMNIISNVSSLNIGVIVHKVAVELEGTGGGSVSSAGATIDMRYTKDFLKRLEECIS